MTRLFLALILIPGVVAAQEKPNRPATRPAQPSARTELDQLRQQIRELTLAVAQLRKEMAELKESLRPAAKGQVKAGPKLWGKIDVGMTLEEVEGITKGKGELKESDGTSKTYRWSIGNSLQVVEGYEAEQYGSYTLTGTFEDGKLVHFRRVDNHDRSQ